MSILDPLEAAAFSLYQNKGAYALLLGSGISRSAQIPTGWDIVLDLVKQVAILKGEDAGANPEQWYVSHFGDPPLYDKLVEEVAKTRDERAHILQQYIEPTEDDREQSRKVPQPAHHAIAELVRLEYVKVVITPNFDRLIETALEQAGVTPAVLSTSDQLIGARPLHQTQIIVLKVNGDYLDTRIRNTEKELSNYESVLNTYLDRIFDEYGLIVCGWSADWDTALCNALYRCPSRRYMTYWVARRGNLRPEASRLVHHRQAQVISVESADDFFPQLLSKVQSLDAIHAPHPLSGTAAASLVKRFIERDEHIQLHDLLQSETEAVKVTMHSPDFPVNIPGITNEKVLDEWKIQRDRYTSTVEKLSRIISAITYFSTNYGTEKLTTSTIERLAEIPLDGGLTFLLNLRFLPALLVAYSAGVSALAAENWGHLRAVLADPMITENRQRFPALMKLVVTNILPSNIFEQFLPEGVGRPYTPGSNFVFDSLRNTLRSLIPSDIQYTSVFDKFEYFLCLVFLDQQPDKTWAPPGAFGWRRDTDPIIQELHQMLSESSELSPVLKAGLFGGKVERLQSALDRQAHFAAEWRRHCHW